jgi:hypothetical protein
MIHDHTFNEVDAWRRLGKAIQGIALGGFDFDVTDEQDTDVDITPAACLDTLFYHIEYGRSNNKIESTQEICSLA